MKKLLSAVLVTGTIAMPVNMVMCSAEKSSTPISHTQKAENFLKHYAVSIEDQLKERREKTEELIKLSKKVTQLIYFENLSGEKKNKLYDLIKVLEEFLRQSDKVMLTFSFYGIDWLDKMIEFSNYNVQLLEEIASIKENERNALRTNSFWKFSSFEKADKDSNSSSSWLTLDEVIGSGIIEATKKLTEAEYFKSLSESHKNKFYDMIKALEGSLYLDLDVTDSEKEAIQDKALEYCGEIIKLLPKDVE